MVFSVRLRLHHVLPVPPPRPEHQQWTSWCVMWTKQPAETNQAFAVDTQVQKDFSIQPVCSSFISPQWFSVTSDPSRTLPAPDRPVFGPLCLTLLSTDRVQASSAAVLFVPPSPGDSSHRGEQWLFLFSGRTHTKK